LLPCNVIVQQLNENEVEIAAVDPVASMGAVENDQLSELALNVKGKLEKVISSLH